MSENTNQQPFCEVETAGRYIDGFDGVHTVWCRSDEFGRKNVTRVCPVKELCAEIDGKRRKGRPKRTCKVEEERMMVGLRMEDVC